MAEHAQAAARGVEWSRGAEVEGGGCSCSSAVSVSNGQKPTRRKRHQVVSMAPEEEKLTRRNPLDLPIE
ncbi:hypothetical protein V6N12_007222 [Hibiscus sabdariffa]|uniref:Uncharacterized protein n=1 Tax=Hibiscus sabdariffa TaxID=183260 RepID=A0ABR2F161_9ROSI